MDAERFTQVEELFHRVLALPVADRRAGLIAATRDDLPLRREVEALLAGDARPGELFEAGPFLQPATRPPLTGRRLGPWIVGELIAEGGMGVVHRATRADGLFHQEVAVKLLRADFASPEMLQRLTAERRLLARLEHPNITRLIDGGTTADGAPYLVMEYLSGLPIDEYCDRHRLGIPARLRLFVAVCQAVHFAHRNLIVHRDLKPNNVLVDAHGVPKLLDFGIARLVDPGADTHTRTGARALTPDYASPEQLQGKPLTTATDVYSLGVMLYELLTGRRPHQRTDLSPAAWERLVTREAPVRPSTAVMRVDSRNPDESRPERLGMPPTRLRRALRGDLDRIVLMALRKEPDRRYASAEQLGEDLERYLAGLPVRAQPDTIRYRMRRFVVRNRIGVASSLLVVLSLCVGLLAARRGQFRAEVARAEALEARDQLAMALESARAASAHAQIEADSFRLSAEFLGDIFLDSASRSLERERVREAVASRAAQMRRQYADQPHLRANLLAALGDVLRRMDLLVEAEDLMREAQQVRLDTFGPRSLEAALSMGELGRLHFDAGRFEDAVVALESALELQLQLPVGVHTDVAGALNDLAAAWRRLGRLEPARQAHEEALARRRAAAGPCDPGVAESLNNLAVVLLEQGRTAEARRMLEEALDIREQVFGRVHPLTLQVLVNLSGVEMLQGGIRGARDRLLSAEHGYRMLGDAGRPGLEQVLSNLSAVETQLGNATLAQERAEEALALVRERLGPEHADVAAVLVRLASLATRQGASERARELWQEALRIQRRSYPAGHPRLARSLMGYGTLLLQDGAVREAEAVLREALDNVSDQHQPDTSDLARAHMLLGVCLLDDGWPDEALPHLDAAVAGFEAAQGADSAESRAARRQRARVDA